MYGAHEKRVFVLQSTSQCKQTKKRIVHLMVRVIVGLMISHISLLANEALTFPSWIDRITYISFRCMFSIWVECRLRTQIDNTRPKGVIRNTDLYLSKTVLSCKLVLLLQSYVHPCNRCHPPYILTSARTGVACEGSVTVDAYLRTNRVHGTCRYTTTKAQWLGV